MAHICDFSRVDSEANLEDEETAENTDPTETTGEKVALSIVAAREGVLRASRHGDSR